MSSSISMASGRLVIVPINARKSEHERIQAPSAATICCAISRHEDSSTESVIGS